MEIIVNKLLAIFFSLLILYNAYFIKRIVGTWLFPAVIFSLFWFAYTFIPLISLFQLNINPSSILYILIITITFSLSTFLFNWNQAFFLNAKKPHEFFNNKNLKLIFYLSTFLSLVLQILNIVLQDITLYDIVFDMFRSAERFASKRYSGDINKNIFGQLSLLFSYLTVIVGGIYMGLTINKSKQFFIILLTFVPALTTMILQSSKGLFFLSVSLFYGGILITRILSNNLVFVNLKTIKNIIISSLVILPFVIISFLSRGLYNESNLDYVIFRLKRYFLSYAFGHIYAFSDWFSFYLNVGSVLNYTNSEQSYGNYTLMAIYKNLGSTFTTPMGIYDDYFSNSEFILTNIYTIFRGLLLDFGLLGSILFIFILGYFLHVSYYMLLQSKKPMLSISVFIFMIGFFYMTYIISLLTWNIIILSFFAFTFLLFAVRRNHSL